MRQYAYLKHIYSSRLELGVIMANTGLIPKVLIYYHSHTITSNSLGSKNDVSRTSYNHSKIIKPSSLIYDEPLYALLSVYTTFLHTYNTHRTRYPLRLIILM